MYIYIINFALQTYQWDFYVKIVSKWNVFMQTVDEKVVFYNIYSALFAILSAILSLKKITYIWTYKMGIVRVTFYSMYLINNSVNVEGVTLKVLNQILNKFRNLLFWNILNYCLMDVSISLLI